MSTSASTPAETTISVAEKFLRDIFETVPAMAGSGQVLELRHITNGAVWERQPKPCACIALVKSPDGQTTLYMGDTALHTDASTPQRIYEGGEPTSYWDIPAGDDPDAQSILDAANLLEGIKELITSIITSPTPWVVQKYRRRQQRIARRARRATLRRKVRDRIRAARQNRRLGHH